MKTTLEQRLTAFDVPLIHLDTNALIELAEPAQRVAGLLREGALSGILPETSAVAWQEFVREPLTPDASLPASLAPPRVE